MPWNLFRRRRGPAEFIALWAAAGLLLPVLATAFLYALLDLDERLTPHGEHGVALATAPIWFSAVLLWPRAGAAARVREAEDIAGLLDLLAQGAAMNAIAFAVMGALLWYALYRRPWAWYGLAGVVAAHWSPSFGMLYNLLVYG
jgi:hypothetical protein